MVLKKYNEKRNFRNTPEPGPKNRRTKENILRFVVQKHAATRLHYDFRLELDGVLKSWAIPKGPSLNPGDKRLAMMVEDHPYDYKDFEGIIPKGNYGAGAVIVWDEGTYRSAETDDEKEGIKKIREGLRKGDLKIILNGKKLKGEFALVHMRSSKDENAWLLIKKKDKYATADDITKKDKSVKSRRTIEQVKEAGGKEDASSESSRKKKILPAGSRGSNGSKKAGNDPFPRRLKPMLAKLTGKPFNDPGWLFEIKWDGYRAIAEIESGKVHIHSRNLLPFDEKFYPIRDLLSGIKEDAVLDGEIVAVDKEGNIRFQNLQNYWRKGKATSLAYYVFDILYCNGKNLMKEPLVKRKEILKGFLPDLPGIIYSDHIFENGIEFFNAAREKEIEGIIAKESASLYYPGKRTSSWLKIKTELRQEVVIAGFTEPRGSRENFGALILGVYDKGQLKYVGHSGSGFNTESLGEAMKKLNPLITDDPPFSEKVKTNSKVTWIKPVLVGEVKFSEWTDSGHMRHPIFMGFREDKEAEEVTYELPVNGHGEPGKISAGSKEKKTGAKSKIITAGKYKVEISNPQKIYWPDEKIKKIQLIDYYNQIGDIMLPYLKDRPESLNRYPEGITGGSFYQKDVDYDVPGYVEKAKIKSESSEKGVINYLLCQNKASLLYIVNLGCIEINPWNSRIQYPENPDYIIVDIDPADDDFNRVIEVALAVKEVLDRAGIKGYCKTSGASGMHVYIPLKARYDYEIAKNFAQLISQLVHNLLPDITSVERSISKRNKKIYVDFLQNRKGQTLAAAYSVRPKPGATVSTPLEWKEVKKGLHPSDFTIFNIMSRVQKKGDLFKGVLGKGVDVEKSVRKLGL